MDSQQTQNPRIKTKTKPHPVIPRPTSQIRNDQTLQTNQPPVIRNENQQRRHRLTPRTKVQITLKQNHERIKGNQVAKPQTVKVRKNRRRHQPPYQIPRSKTLTPIQ